MIDFPQIPIQKIAFKLKPKAEILIKKGHPWVFENSIIKQNKPGQAGDIAVIFDTQHNKFLACGFYDPHSPIKIKILQANKPANINADWFKARIDAAYEKRKPLLATDTNSYRLIFGENDHLPGLVADVYDHVLVIKLYATYWFYHLQALLPYLIEKSGVQTCVLRMSRNVQKEGNAFGFEDGQVIHGSLPDPLIHFKEHGVRFSANVIHGHKTGYFLDHRANRKKVGELAKGKTVLDVFSYAGGFSVHALAGGATEVSSLDISAPALTIAQYNAGLNDYSGKHHIIVGDAFKALEDLALQKKKFDIVVIDPPAFAKSANEIPGALASYKNLTQLGAQLVAKNGILIMASCSSRVNAETFFNLVLKTLDQAGKDYQILEETQHDVDHPISFPEGAYLKSIYLKILN